MNLNGGLDAVYVQRERRSVGEIDGILADQLVTERFRCRIGRRHQRRYGSVYSHAGVGDGGVRSVDRVPYSGQFQRVGRKGDTAGIIDRPEIDQVVHGYGNGAKGSGGGDIGICRFAIEGPCPRQGVRSRAMIAFLTSRADQKADGNRYKG